METQAKLEINSTNLHSLEKSVGSITQDIEKLHAALKSGGGGQRSASSIPVPPVPVDQHMSPERTEEYKQVTAPAPGARPRWRSPRKHHPPVP